MNVLVGGSQGDDEAPGHRTLPYQEDAVGVEVVGQDLVGLVPGDIGVVPGLALVHAGLGLRQAVRHGSRHSPPAGIITVRQRPARLRSGFNLDLVGKSPEG